MPFSKGLILADLDDFITPSQACVKPVERPSTLANKQTPVSAEPSFGDAAFPRMTIEMDEKFGRSTRNRKVR
ncbi:Cytosolic Fe-S cluster assembly factor nar1, partial [Massospora cicadina]